jgi:hypothetical protein
MFWPVRNMLQIFSERDTYRKNFCTLSDISKKDLFLDLFFMISIFLSALIFFG